MNQTKEKKTRYLLWPALLLLLLLLAPGNIVRVQAASDQTAVQLKLSQGIRRYDYAYQVLDLVNQERAKKNRNPVTMDKNLLECAMTRAEELTVCASHTRPNGSICFSAFPYFENPSENLAINQGTPEEVMESWIESSGHYTNIMNSKNVSAGIGCYSQNGHLYWIQCFSSHATEACTQPANQTVSPVISVLPKLINIHFNEASPITFTEEQKTLAIYITCNGFSYMSSSLDPASFTWSTGDPSIATVDQSGVIRLKSRGTTTVSATLKSCPDKTLSADLNAYYDLENSRETSLRYTSSWNYTGSPITFSPELKFHGRTLTEGKDYTISFSHNQNSGVGTFTITGLGLYSGTLTNNFGIWQINLSQAEIDFSQSSYLYTGTPLTPKPTVTPVPKPSTTPAPMPSGTPAPVITKLTAPSIKASASWNSCTLRWNHINNARNYILYRKTNSGKYTKIKTLNANTTSYKDTKITIGNKYSYVIRASKKTSSGYIYSPVSKAVTVKPNLLRPSTKLKTFKGKQTLSWKKIPGATGYVIYQKKGNGSFKKVKTISSKNTSYTFKTAKNVTYSYRLVPYRTVNKKVKTGPASAVKTGKAK